ncbi:hypothetical protein ZOSMA_46G00320, partial [Zostera marina]
MGLPLEGKFQRVHREKEGSTGGQRIPPTRGIGLRPHVAKAVTIQTILDLSKAR